MCATVAQTLRDGKGICISNFGTWSFHVDHVELGTQRKIMRTPVFALSEKFARLYNVRFPKQPSGISGEIPVRDLTTMAIATAAGQPRDLVSTALKDIFLYVGETALAGGPVKLEFAGVGAFMCAGGQCKFLFAPHFAGTFQSVERPLTQGVIPPSPSVFARMRPRSSGFPPTQQLQKPPTPSLRPMSQGSQRPPPSRGSSRGGLRMDGGGSGEGMSSHHLMSMTGQSENVDVQRLGTPQQRGGTPLTKPRGRGGDAEAAQVFVLRDSGLEVKELEITVRGRELVVRQRNIGFERVYPLHARVDTERISAKFKNGALEIRLPDKAHSLRAFYAAQIRERDMARRVEEEEDASLLALDEKKTAMALDLERQALIARRRARAEVEAFNRKAAKAYSQKRDLFQQPDSCGYLLYNRKEDEDLRLPPDVLRKVLDTQVQMKKDQEQAAKNAEREAVEKEVEELRRELAEDERKANSEKRRRQQQRMKELSEQMAMLEPRLPGAFSSICDFPRLDNDDMAQQLKRDQIRKTQDEVLGMVQTRGQEALEAKRNQFRQEMEELRHVQQTLEEEEAERISDDQRRKYDNRQVWRKQIKEKRILANENIPEPLYATSLKVGEVETALIKTVKPQPTAEPIAI